MKLPVTPVPSLHLLVSVCFGLFSGETGKIFYFMIFQRNYPPLKAYISVLEMLTNWLSLHGDSLLVGSGIIKDNGTFNVVFVKLFHLILGLKMPSTDQVT